MSDKIGKLLEKATAQAVSISDASSSVSRAGRDFADAPEAEKRFVLLKAKLFQINRWNADSGLTSFKLFDGDGNEPERDAAIVGDFVRLTLTGSGKSDWVRISKIEDAPDEVILTVQPSYNPTESKPDKSVTSHFFTAESSNNFCLEKKGARINFYVVGLDEKTNTHDTSGVIETVRNAATANLGHFLGIQEGEWKLFCENFLEKG